MRTTLGSGDGAILSSIWGAMVTLWSIGDNSTVTSIHLILGQSIRFLPVIHFDHSVNILRNNDVLVSGRPCVVLGSCRLLASRIEHAVVSA